MCGIWVCGVYDVGCGGGVDDGGGMAGVIVAGVYVVGIGVGVVACVMEYMIVLVLGVLLVVSVRIMVLVFDDEVTGSVCAVGGVAGVAVSSVIAIGGAGGGVGVGGVGGVVIVGDDTSDDGVDDNEITGVDGDVMCV